MYTEFDKECFPLPRGTNDYRSPFAIDRDRVIHSRAFRRLQAKTQVFNSGEYDFYRTRLTHSVEVGQIGRSICASLAHNHPTSPKVDQDLVEAACLSHDLGNPPFGHSGERTLHACMEDFGGFEGNAQTMRLITGRIFTETTGRTGMKPTRALMDAVCKYKVLRTPEMKNHFLYEEQLACLNFIHDGLNLTEQSLECQIMDWSDDIANGYADVNDGFKARLIDVRSLERWAQDEILDSEQTADLDTLFVSVRQGDTEKFRAKGIGDCIKAVSIAEHTNALSARSMRHAYKIVIDPRMLKRCYLMKKIAHGIVIQSALVQQLEMKTHRMMSSLFQMLFDNYAEARPKALLPHEAHVEVVQATEPASRARYICDHLSGMSDDFAVRTYRRLFDPTFGSIGDFI